jgi:hypothetical protein
MMDEHQHLPTTNQLSVLSAAILLAYALTPFVNLPLRTFSMEVAGIVFNIQLNFTSVISIIVAVLAAVGTDWLLRSHPQAAGHSLIHHWILPGLTAWVIGIPLNTLKIGPEWWVVFSLGSVLLILVFVAEYITVDFNDERHQLATIGLTAVAFALYLFLAIALRAAGLRLYLIVPALVVSLMLVSLRTLFLRLGGNMRYAWAAGISIVVGQLAIGLHYWRIAPLAFGLALLGPAYALTSIAGSLEEDRPWQMIWIEPAIILLVLWGLAFFL